MFCTYTTASVVAVKMFSYIYYLAKKLEEKYMSLGNILLVILILMLVGVFPAWPHSHSWGYAPSGGVGLLLIIVVLFLLFGRR